jgi:pSer/pThr/pTyr-binding forkhead associated (FHA) protein
LGQPCQFPQDDYIAAMAAEQPRLPQSLRIRSDDAGPSAETSLLARKSIVIGRGAECDVVVNDVKASRRHCRLTRGEDAFILEDLGSKNGTFVGGDRISAPVSLKLNQTFKVGDTIFYLS